MIEFNQTPEVIYRAAPSPDAALVMCPMCGHPAMKFQFAPIMRCRVCKAVSGQGTWPGLEQSEEGEMGEANEAKVERILERVRNLSEGSRGMGREEFMETLDLLIERLEEMKDAADGWDFVDDE